MRLPEGIIQEKEEVDATFGLLKFSALRREVRDYGDDGTQSEEVKERTYDLKSQAQGRMIQVSIPGDIPAKDFSYNAEIEIINPVLGTVANATFGNSAEVDWYIKADDIVLRKAGNPQMNPINPSMKKEVAPEK